MPVVNTLKRHLAAAKKQGNTAQIESLEARIALIEGTEPVAPAVAKTVAKKTTAKKTAKKTTKKATKTAKKGA